MSRVREVIIKESSRGLWYEDGVFKRTLSPGRYELPPLGELFPWQKRIPKVEVLQIDIREREITIKGQEILTSDKVAIRVSIIVNFKVLDPAAAIHNVQNYEDRIYSDVQLAARRSLASMTLEEILTNRNRLSEDILRDVKESAGGYGVSVLRADVKDLVFPGNLQEIMNRVLAAERLAQAQLVESRTKAENQRIEADTRAYAQLKDAEAAAQSLRLRAQAEADAQHVRSQADADDTSRRESLGKMLADHPALLRLRELEAIAGLAQCDGARIYIGMDKYSPVSPGASALDRNETMA